MKVKLLSAILAVLMAFALAGAAFADGDKPGKGGKGNAGGAAAATTGTPKPAPGADKQAQQLAAKFGVSVAEINGWKSQGFGWGEIGKAYALVAAAKVSAATLFNRVKAGEGWGVIAQSYGFKVLGGGTNARVEPLNKPTSTPSP